jgi:hypothetical protein
MLATGWSQAEVRRHWNQFLGEEVFTANNISSHCGKHLNVRDLALWPLRSRCVGLFLEDATQGGELGVAVMSTLRAAVQLLLSSGLGSLREDLVEVEPADMFRAMRMLEQLDEAAIGAERAAMQRERDEMLREFQAFSDAVKIYVPKQQWPDLYDSFERLLLEHEQSLQPG